MKVEKQPKKSLGEGLGKVKLASWALVALKNTNLTKNAADEEVPITNDLGASQISKQTTKLVTQKDVSILEQDRPI